MSRKKLMDAIGSIDETFIEEYASYQPKSRIVRWMPYELAAACAVLLIGAGVWMWKGNSNLTPSDGNSSKIVADQDSFPSREPDHTSVPYDETTPLPTASEEAEEPDAAAGIQEQEDEQNGQNGQSREHKSVTADGRTTQESDIPDVISTDVPFVENEPDKEEDSDNSSSGFGLPSDNPDSVLKPQPASPKPPFPDQEQVSWNIVTACNEPYDGVIDRLLEEVKVTDAPAPLPSMIPEEHPSSSMEPMATMAPADPEPVAPADPDSSGDCPGVPDSSGSSMSEQLHDRWVCYDETLTEDYQLSVLFENQDSFDSASVLYLYLKGQDSTICIAQERTAASNLREASRLSSQDVFNYNPTEHMFCDVSVYFVKDRNDHCYVRFLYKGILVTLWENGASEDFVLQLVESMLTYS